MNELHEVEVIDSKENWSYYKVDDDTIIKLKLILVRIFTRDNGCEVPQEYMLQTTNVVGAMVQQKVITSNASEIIDIGFQSQKETWNEYTLDNGCTFLLKPMIIQIDRTTARDPLGAPLYRIQAQHAQKIKRVELSDNDTSKWL